MTAPAEPTTAPATDTFPPAFLELLGRAESGDTTVLPALRRLLDDCPEVWQRVGDLARHAELTLLRETAGSNLLLSEAVTRKLADLKTELAEPADGALHRLLIERVVVNWLEVYAVDTRCRTLREQFAAPAQVEALERRRTGSQRRYLASLRSLATVRKLLRTAPSPVEIASRLQPRGTVSGTARRERSQHAGVGTLN